MTGSPALVYGLRMANKSRAAEELERLIRRQGETLQVAADRLGVGKSTLGCWLKGHREPGRAKAVVAQEIYGVPVTWWGQPAESGERKAGAAA